MKYMKNIGNSRKVEKTRSQDSTTLTASKPALTHRDEERWLSATNKSVKSHTYELGRQKRTW
jgi:hypothetical protein